MSIRLLLLLAAVLPAAGTIAQEVKNITNLNASAGAAYFNLELGKQIHTDRSHTADWDISFAKTTISLNEKAGVTAQVVAVSFESLGKAPAAGYRKDTDESKAIPTGSGNGWYNYNIEDHTILPIADRTIVVKTGNGKKYKIGISSYNKDGKLFEGTGFYTFRYAVID